MSTSAISTRLWVGAASAAAFLALTVLGLGLQGAQYDELHQAVGAFAWCGRPTVLFNSASLLGFPLLNMTYSGAIKSAMFGVWLRATGCEFTITAWRLTALLTVAMGMVLFSVLSRASARTIGWTLVLLITDVTVLLGTRHDYGPVALGLAIRLVMLGLWFRVQRSGSLSAGATFALGASVGFAAVEKLSSLVLIPVLMLFVLSDGRLRRGRCLVFCAAGVVAGLLPLVFVNALSLSTSGTLVSAGDVVPPRLDWTGLPAYLRSYLSLGAGAELRAWILGDHAPSWARMAELASVSGFLVLGVSTHVRDRSRPAADRTGCGPLVGAYLLCVGATWLLPATGTEPHHWIVGTPFQYATVAVIASRSTGVRQRVAALGAVVLIACRITGLVATESSLVRGRYGSEWDPALTRMGLWAARQPADTMFIAADWGVATQITCFSDARHVPTELFWDYRDHRQLLDTISARSPSVFYVVSLASPSPVNPAATQRLLADAARLADWREEYLADGPSGLGVVDVRRFVRGARGF